jgi:hypothetical protein
VNKSHARRPILSKFFRQSRSPADPRQAANIPPISYSPDGLTMTSDPSSGLKNRPKALMINDYSYI